MLLNCSTKLNDFLAKSDVISTISTENIQKKMYSLNALRLLTVNVLTDVKLRVFNFIRRWWREASRGAGAQSVTIKSTVVGSTPTQ